jgi:uncharacterized protein (DUF362 family)
MILSVAQENTLYAALDKIGLGAAVRKSGSVLIKINLAHPPEPQHPRTDPFLLAQVIQYVARCEARCAIAEGADGFLPQNIESIGFGDLVKENHIEVLDLDLEDTDCVIVDDEKHYIPKCLKNYAVRVGIPATSKRPGMTFSNNVKLFVGAVPRRMYQSGEASSPRPIVHADLHKSVANIYQAIMAYAPFSFFVNGGKAMFEDRGEVDLDEILVGSDALELDQFVLRRFGLEPPDYIRRLVEMPQSHPGQHIFDNLQEAKVERKPLLLDLLKQAREIEMNFVDMLSDQERARIGTLEDWSAKDVISHITARKALAAEGLLAISEARSPISSEDLDRENVILFKEYQDKTWDEVLRLAADAFQKVAAQLERLGEQELARRERFFSWQRERPLWRLIVGSGCIHPLGHIAEFHRNRGNREWVGKMIGEIARSMENLDDSPTWQGEMKYNLACMHSLLGAKAEAIRELRQALVLNPELTDLSMEDSDLDAIRGEPEYQAIYKH